MKNVIKMSLATAIMMSMGTVSAQAADEISIVDNVKVKGEIRPRYEMVDEDNAKPNANALTNRLVIGVGGDLFGTDWLSGYAEMTDVSSLNENYDSTANGEANSIVADPEQTRVTQSYLDLKYNKTKLRYGRQMINLDNQRFIGAVGWRQMPQTYDATSIMDNSFENLSLMATYSTQRNLVFADSATKTNSKNSEDVFLNAKYKAMDALTVTAYGYLLGSTGDTYGLALTGKTKVSDIGLSYRAEYAMMTDASMEVESNGKPDNDADYINLEAGVNVSGFLAGVNYEVQSGTSATDTSGTNKTFSTPYGTNHKFNGWADMFLATPDEGLVDLNVMVGYKSKDVGVLKAIYHDFTSDVDSIDYGTEIDLLYTRAIPGVKGLSGMLKYADYNADTYKVDTQKFWAMLTYKFSN